MEKNTAGAAIFAQNPCVYQKKAVSLQRFLIIRNHGRRHFCFAASNGQSVANDHNNLSSVFI
jgi:hypothetical protein